MEFIDPKTDFAFKRIFGSEDSKTVLVSFINAALKLYGDRQVVAVDIKNPYQVRHLPIQKDSIVDIACTDGRGIEYLVEMQVEKVKGFANRMVYNLSKCYSGQLIKGEDYPRLHDVVLIAVMDFSLFEGLDPYHSLFVMKDTETNYAPLNQLRLCCLELGKFKKTEKELLGMLDKWAFFLKETGHLEVRPAALGEEAFDGAFQKAQLASLTKKEREAYDAALQEARDKRGMIAEGEDKGRAEGRVEGRAEEKEAMASRMLEKGLDIVLIGEITGLSRETLATLMARRGN